MGKKFIKGAIRHPGELREFAKTQGCMTSSGKVDLSCIDSHIQKIHNPKKRRHLMRAANLARILHRLRPHKSR